MAGITMCSNTACPLRPTCYRAQAPANPQWQSYAHFTPTSPHYCAFYMHVGIEEEDTLEKIEERLDRGYTQAVYGTAPAIHEQMQKDIRKLLELWKSVSK